MSKWSDWIRTCYFRYVWYTIFSISSDVCGEKMLISYSSEILSQVFVRLNGCYWGTTYCSYLDAEGTVHHEALEIVNASFLMGIIGLRHLVIIEY